MSLTARPILSGRCMGRKTKRTCGWWRDDGVSARNISELNGYRRRDGGKTKRFKSLHAFILD